MASFGVKSPRTKHRSVNPPSLSFSEARTQRVRGTRSNERPISQFRCLHVTGIRFATCSTTRVIARGVTGATHSVLASAGSNLHADRAGRDRGRRSGRDAEHHKTPVGDAAHPLTVSKSSFRDVTYRVVRQRVKRIFLLQQSLTSRLIGVGPDRAVPPNVEARNGKPVERRRPQSYGAKTLPVASCSPSRRTDHWRSTRCERRSGTLSPPSRCLVLSPAQMIK
jgi:hypothetical protein